MGKVNNALRMLAILRSRGKVTRQELAEELEVNPREITRYKEDLESAGVTITNIKGKYGGYVLESKDYLLNLGLSNDEEVALNNVVNHLKIQGNYLYKDLESIRDKIAISKNEYIQYQDESVYYSNSIKLRININDERDKWLQINDSIINNKKAEKTKISNNLEHNPTHGMPGVTMDLHMMDKLDKFLQCDDYKRLCPDVKGDEKYAFKKYDWQAPAKAEIEKEAARWT